MQQHRGWYTSRLTINSSVPGLWSRGNIVVLAHRTDVSLFVSYSQGSITLKSQNISCYLGYADKRAPWQQSHTSPQSQREKKRKKLTLLWTHDLFLLTMVINMGFGLFKHVLYMQRKIIPCSLSVEKWGPWFAWCRDYLQRKSYVK